MSFLADSLFSMLFLRGASGKRLDAERVMAKIRLSLFAANPLVPDSVSLALMQEVRVREQKAELAAARTRFNQETGRADGFIELRNLLLKRDEARAEANYSNLNPPPTNSQSQNQSGGI